MERITLKIGEKGKKYGLLTTKKEFCVDSESDDEENVVKKANKDIIKASLYKQSYSADVYSALAEDPTIFSYDLYKSKAIKETEKEPIKGPQYHESIKRTAEFKKREKEVIKERLEAKLLEGYNSTEVYYTQSYQNFVKDNKKFEEKLNSDDLASELKSIEHKNPDSFLNNIISTSTFEPYKKIKIEENPSNNENSLIKEDNKNILFVEKQGLQEEKQKNTVKITEKRSESEVLSAKERYLARKRQQNS